MWKWGGPPALAGSGLTVRGRRGRGRCRAAQEGSTQTPATPCYPEPPRAPAPPPRCPLRRSAAPRPIGHQWRPGRRRRLPPPLLSPPGTCGADAAAPLVGREAEPPSHKRQSHASRPPRRQHLRSCPPSSSPSSSAPWRHRRSHRRRKPSRPATARPLACEAAVHVADCGPLPPVGALFSDECQCGIVGAQSEGRCFSMCWS